MLCQEMNERESLYQERVTMRELDWNVREI